MTSRIRNRLRCQILALPAIPFTLGSAIRIEGLPAVAARSLVAWSATKPMSEPSGAPRCSQMTRCGTLALK